MARQNFFWPAPKKVYPSLPYVMVIWHWCSSKVVSSET